MKITLKPSAMKIMRSSVRWVVIHHTSEMYAQPSARIDNDNFQLPQIYNGTLELKQPDINYHYVIEQIKNEYHILACRPFSYLCEWPDISNEINKRAMHIALLGNYDVKIPPKRLYNILAYRLINPILKTFHIDANHIVLHRGVSNDKELSCPGIFTELSEIITSVRKFVIK